MNSAPLDTPVVFLIFNRPDTTARVFAEIARAQPRQLFVVADGPRPHVATDAERCAAARAVVEQVDWECQVSTNYAETNLGCGRRVSSGITWAFAQVEEAIILEDDCVPHPDFFGFCHRLLARYREDERVMMISGSNMLSRLDIPESYTFSRYFNVWGWATWRRAWAAYSFTLPEWTQRHREGQLAYYYPYPYVVRYLRKNFDLIEERRIDTWDIQWFYACLFNNGLSVVPRGNLVSNIGVVGTHTQGAGDPSLPIYSLDTEHLVHPRHVFADVRYDKTFFWIGIKEPWSAQVRRYWTSLRYRLRHLMQRAMD